MDDELKSYFHVCTDGNRLPWMFQDAEDFRYAVNRLAVGTIVFDVSLLSYVLMDNHIHLVLRATMHQCRQFVNSFKKIFGKWIRTKYGVSGHLRDLPTSIIPIRDKETLLETIAYIDRNAIVAGYRFLPGEYLWGSARYMFKDRTLRSCSSVKRISEFKSFELRELIKTHEQLPSHWEVDEHGMIMPCCFLDVDFLERIFVSPIKYLYYLSRKLEGKVEMLQGVKAFIPDREMRVITRNLVQERFGTHHVRQLDFKSKIAIARKLRFNYASTVKQISRMLEMDPEALSEFI